LRGAEVTIAGRSVTANAADAVVDACTVNVCS